MEKLKSQTFKAKDWARPGITVEGRLTVRDRQTLAPADKISNPNGYVICIENESGYNIVDPNSIELLRS